MLGFSIASAVLCLYAAVLTDTVTALSASAPGPLRAQAPIAPSAGRDTSTFLVVGVKSSVVHNFEQRHAIRETWGNQQATQQHGVRVVFLGCSPDLSSFTDDSERARLTEAIALEKRTFHDLLTDELGCVDSYYQLLHKVVHFMGWAVGSVEPEAPGLRYVMVVDDDVYLRLHRIVESLRHRSTPRTRFYAGFVYVNLRPMRDSAHKNYIPLREYPMPTLPPFVGGPHYLLSIDLVKFVVRNAVLLKGLRALDDVSVALWLELLLRVRPVHLSGFILLRASACQANATALADMSPRAVRLVHENLASNRSLCANVESSSVLHRCFRIVSPGAGSGDKVMGDASGHNLESNTKLTWELLHDAESSALQIRVTITVINQAIDFVYIPSASSYEEGLCGRGAILMQDKMYTLVDAAFCEYHRRALLAFIHSYVQEKESIRALVTLTQHNLATTARVIITVGISRGARCARVLIECLLVQMFPDTQIRVLGESAFLDKRLRPNIFVFSILDESIRVSNTAVPHRARFLELFDDSTQLLMISGEAWPVGVLEPRITLLTTVRTIQHVKQAYLPVASMMFAESIEHNPVNLLDPRPHHDTSERRFCAYLYARCDLLAREYMFDLLNDVEHVDALGACQGARRTPITKRLASRYQAPIYTDEAIRLYGNYKFVIAFENTLDAVGYVTEKIVTAFLAGAVPIYYGHTESVAQLFNPKAFINCGEFKSLRACSRRVLEIHASDTEYEKIHREPPIVNQSAFLDAFGWHPSVTPIARGWSNTQRRNTVSEQLKDLVAIKELREVL